jgi:hypothetical protein
LVYLLGNGLIFIPHVSLLIVDLSTISSPKSRAGTDYIEKDKIIRRWKECTKGLYKKDQNTSLDIQEKAYTQEPLVMKSEVTEAL